MTSFQHYIPVGSSVLVGVVCVCNAALFGFSCVIVKKMHSMHHSVILFYMGLGLMLLSALTYPYDLTLHKSTTVDISMDISTMGK